MREDGSDAVLKLVTPCSEADGEAAALRAYDGRGAVRLLAHDAARGALLLERCVPGDDLAAFVPERDDEATALAAGVMRALRRPLPADVAFPELAVWTSVLERIRNVFGGSAGPMEQRVLDAAISFRRELLGSPPEAELLHGDLHHHNVLRATRDGRAGWLAIDPKGLAGDPAYEPAPYFYNPLGDWHARARIDARFVRRRIDLMAAHTGLDAERIRGWAVVQGVVSSAWSYEDGRAGRPFAEHVAALALDA